MFGDLLIKQIGEFANDNQVTIKALHHYEKLGLLLPSRVDEFTGYRYYEDEKSEVLKVIAFLKSLGFSLSEIVSIDIVACEKFAQHIIDEVKAIELNDVADGLYASVTIGIASIDTENKSMGKLFYLAETALFEAKSKERGTYCIYSE